MYAGNRGYAWTMQTNTMIRFAFDLHIYEEEVNVSDPSNRYIAFPVR